MTTREKLAQALRAVDLQIYVITCRAVELERAFAAMLALDADTAAADEALRSTYQALGLYRQRRAAMQRDVDELSARG